MAFRIIEDSLRDMLEPSESPCDYTDELYFSKYNFVPTEQANSSMNSAAATLMALNGSGISGYTQTSVQNKLNADSSTSKTINKITNLLRKEIPDKNGYSVRTRAFVPINGSAYTLISCIETALALDTVPVIQVNGDYYGGVSGTRYIVATCVDIVAECVTVFDPHSNHYGKDYIYYNEMDNLLTKSGVIWVSAFGRGEMGASGLAKMMAEYPDGSYYSTTGKACTCHTTCDWTSGSWCTCIKYKNSNGVNIASQCAGFAMQVFDVVMGRSYGSSEATRTKTINKSLDEGTAKKYLKGRTVGTYVRVSAGNTRHSVAVISTSETGITVYQANYGGRCLVSYVTYTWKEFAQRFPYLYYYVD